VPRISSFYGIVISMYHDEAHHQVAHFHAAYGEHEASIDVETLWPLAGALPARAQRLVTEWATAHQAELRANWARARELKPLKKIEPLP